MSVLVIEKKKEKKRKGERKKKKVGLSADRGRDQNVENKDLAQPKFA